MPFELEKPTQQGVKLVSVMGLERLNKYLTFVLGKEEYGLEILRVKEIIGLMNITSVPRMPQFVRGVINLRGKVIPVVDLRLKFEMEQVQDTQETCIIVVDLDDTLIGVVVDKVSEVLDIESDEIDEAPSFGVTLDTSFILGIGKSKNKVVLLLDIARVLVTETAGLTDAALTDETLSSPAQKGGELS